MLWETPVNRVLLMLLFQRLGTLLKKTFSYWLKKGLLSKGRALDKLTPGRFFLLGFYPPMLPGTGRPHIPLLWEAGNRKSSAT